MDRIGAGIVLIVVGILWTGFWSEWWGTLSPSPLAILGVIAILVGGVMVAWEAV
jgi:hypothetical protein